MLQDAFPALLVLGGFCFVLALGGAVAKYVFPHIKPIERFLDSLPMSWL